MDGDITCVTTMSGRDSWIEKIGKHNDFRSMRIKNCSLCFDRLLSCGWHEFWTETARTIAAAQWVSDRSGGVCNT